jgi:hypothetical protein
MQHRSCSDIEILRRLVIRPESTISAGTSKENGELTFADLQISVAVVVVAPQIAPLLSL